MVVNQSVTWMACIVYIYPHDLYFPLHTSVLFINIQYIYIYVYTGSPQIMKVEPMNIKLNENKSET